MTHPSYTALSKWHAPVTPPPRDGHFSSTHWIHGFDSEEAPYSQHDMFMDMTGKSKVQNMAMTLGLVLERPIGEIARLKISKEMGIGDLQIDACPTRVLKYEGVNFRDTCDFILSRPDWEETYGLEIKTVSSFKQKKLWGEEWTDQVPLHVKLQCWAHMHANGLDKCFVASWFYTPNEPTIYLVERPEESEMESVMDNLVAWHRQYIDTDEMLSIDGSAGCSKYLQRIEQAQDDIIEADEDDMGLMSNYVVAKKMSAEAKLALEEAKNNLKARIGESAGISFGDYGKVKWTGKKTRRMTDTIDLGE